jgi:hypothetical protein
VSEKVTIAEAIRELRGQLIKAMSEGEKERIRFRPTSVELELAITFTREAEADGKVGVWAILDLSAKAKFGDQKTHKVKLILEPVQPVALHQPVTSPAASAVEKLETLGTSSQLTMKSMSPRVLDSLRPAENPEFTEVILRLPASADAKAQLLHPTALNTLSQATGAVGNEAGSAFQTGAINFESASDAFTSVVSGIIQNPEDPRHQVLREIFIESLAKNDSTRVDEDGEQSA